MAKDEKTSPSVAAIAGHVLSTGHATTKEAMTLAAAALTEAPDRKPAVAPKPAPKPAPVKPAARPSSSGGRKR